MKFHYQNKQPLQCGTASKGTLLYQIGEGLVSHKRYPVSTWISGCRSGATQLSRWFDAHLQHCVHLHNCLWGNWIKEKLDSREANPIVWESSHPLWWDSVRWNPPWKETIRLIASETPVLRPFYYGEQSHQMNNFQIGK